MDDADHSDTSSDRNGKYHQEEFDFSEVRTTHARTCMHRLPHAQGGDAQRVLALCR